MPAQDRNRNRVWAVRQSGAGGSYHPDQDWLDAEAYFLADPADYTLAGGGDIEEWSNRGTAGGFLKQLTPGDQFTPIASEPNTGRPSVELAGSQGMIWRNDADTADLALSNALAVNGGLMLAVSRSDIAPSATDRTIVGDSFSGNQLSFVNAGIQGYRAQAYDSAIRFAMAGGNVALVTHVMHSRIITANPDITANLDGADIATGFMTGGNLSSTFLNAALRVGNTVTSLDGQLSMIVVMKTTPVDLPARITRLISYFNL